MRKLFMFIGLVLLLTSCKKKAFEDEEIIYKITFTGNWNSTNHPNNFPSGDHFSPITGMIHNNTVSLFEEGSMASSGIEKMAESGNPSTLESEIKALGNDKFRLLKMGSVDKGNGIVNFQFDASEEHTYISLVSMIAPSPDWFIALNNYNLKPNGKWIDKITIPVAAYDAGTEEGSSYSYNNDDQNPQLPISTLDIETVKKGNKIEPFGYFTLEKFVIYNN